MTDEQHKDGSPSSVAYVAESDIGRTLRRAREAKGLSVADVAKQLRIDQRHIEAVESDDYGKVSGSVFVRGYLRNYARLLEIDAAPLIAAFDRSGQSQQPKMMRVGQVGPMPRLRARTGPSKQVLGAIVLVVLVLVALWLARGSLTWNGGAITDSATVTGDSLLDLPGLDLSREPSAEDVSDVGSAAPSMELPIPPPKTSSLAPSVAATLPATPAEPAGVDVGATAAKADAAGAARATLGLEFGRDSYVKVVDAKRKSLFAQIGKAGEKRWVSGVPPFSVTLGNPNDVMINLNGQAVSVPASANKPNAVVVVGLDSVQ